MTQNLISTAPTSYERLLKLVEEAAEEQNKTSSAKVLVFPFETGPYEPSQFVTVEGIEHVGWRWESIGSFSHIEEYEIFGTATSFTGDTVTSLGIATGIMKETYALFENLVMKPVMSNRTAPVLGGSEHVYLMEPRRQMYKPAPGVIDGKPGGWVGTVEWSFFFAAYVTPG